MKTKNVWQDYLIGLKKIGDLHYILYLNGVARRER